MYTPPPGRTQDFFKGGGFKIFSSRKFENRAGRKVAQWGGGGGGKRAHFFFFFGLEISKFDIFCRWGGGGKVTLFRLAVGIDFFFFFFFK